VDQSGHTDLSCFFDAEPVGIGTVAEADCGRGFVQFDFVNKLSSAPDFLREVNADGFVPDNAPTGLVCPSGIPVNTCLAAVPEPPALWAPHLASCFSAGGRSGAQASPVRINDRERRARPEIAYRGLTLAGDRPNADETRSVRSTEARR